MRHGSDTLLWKLMDASVEQWVGFGVGLVSIFVLIWLIFRVRSWLRDDEDPAASDHRMLTQMGDLHRRGDLSEEEYRSIKSQLIERIDSRHDRPR